MTQLDPPDASEQNPTPQNGMGTAALVLGILGLVGCLGLTVLLPLLATIFGALGRKKAKEGLANNGGQATAGLVMGIIGLAIGSLYWVLNLVFGVAVLSGM